MFEVEGECMLVVVLYNLRQEIWFWTQGAIHIVWDYNKKVSTKETNKQKILLRRGMVLQQFTVVPEFLALIILYANGVQETGRVPLLFSTFSMMMTNTR